MQIDIEANTTIGEESFFEGRFAIRGSLRIDGRFEGQALLVDQLQIGPKGRVKTNIIAMSRKEMIRRVFFIRAILSKARSVKPATKNKLQKALCFAFCSLFLPLGFFGQLID